MLVVSIHSSLTSAVRESDASCADESDGEVTPFGVLICSVSPLTVAIEGVVV